MKVDRLVSIVMLLLRKKRMGAQKLAKLFEVSPRTIYRDIDAINRAGIPVRSIPGVGGGFEIMESYKVDKSVFSTADLSAILMGLSNLPDIMHGDELTNALAKVESFIPTDQAKDIELKANQICIDLTPWMGNQDIRSNLELIRMALQKTQTISFSYTDHRSNQTTRTVEPYQLVLKNSHWYLHGYCRKRNALRLFKLSRMSNLQRHEETFEPLDHEKPHLEFDDQMEVKQTRIELRIHRAIMERVLDYCSLDRFLPDGDDHYLVDFPIVENDWSYDMLLGFGETCECLGPPHVRAALKRKAEALASLYA